MSVGSVPLSNRVTLSRDKVQPCFDFLVRRQDSFLCQIKNSLIFVCLQAVSRILLRYQYLMEYIELWLENNKSYHHEMSLFGNHVHCPQCWIEQGECWEVPSSLCEVCSEWPDSCGGTEEKNHRTADLFSDSRNIEVTNTSMLRTGLSATSSASRSHTLQVC